MAKETRVTPEGITRVDGRQRTDLYPPSLKGIMEGLLADGNWLRELEQLKEDQCLCGVANFLPGANQKEIVYGPLRQYVYHLKYMPFYASEYKEMYQDILERVIPARELEDEGIRVCSIGAGNLVDYWALSSAFFNWAYARYSGKELREHMEKLAYLGIDCVQWRYPVSFLDVHKSSCATLFEDIASEEARKKIAGFAPTVYFFPKSLNELGDQHTSSVVEAIAASKVDKVYIAFSFPASDEESEDAEAVYFGATIDGLRKKLADTGFSLGEKPVSECKIGEQAGNIDRSLVDLVAEKAEGFCVASCEHGDSGESCQQGYRWAGKLKAFIPMNKKSYMNWQVYECVR